MNESSLSALQNKQVWYSVGRKFNDPFDCSLNVPLNIMTGASILDFIKSRTSAQFLLERGLIHEEQINYLALNYLNDAQRLMNEGRAKEHPMSPILDLVAASLQRSFVCCYSKNATNHLLWSHYANAHSGFCIRYNKSILFNDIKPRLYGDVIYNDDPIDLMSIFKDYSDLANDIIYRKSSCWSYEDEVRLIHNDLSKQMDDINRVDIHSSDAIDCIILGFNFNMDRLNELKDKVDTSKTMFKKIKRSENNYNLYVPTERL